MNLFRAILVPALALAALVANAAVIDFENLSNDGDVGETSQGSPVVSGGFAFAVAGGFRSYYSEVTGGVYTGSIALFAPTNDTVITMTKAGGASFTLNSMQLANQRKGTTQGQTITFTGLKIGGGTVTNTFTLGTGNALQTDTFAGFTNLESVSWRQAGAMHQFDNLVVDVNPTPEPSALAALSLGAVAMLKRRRRA